MTDTRSFITTRPRCAPCPRCGRLQLTGHAEGLPYRVDPVPVTPRAELAARLSGRSSFAFIAEGLAVRTAGRIDGDARRPRPPVLVAHHCDTPPAPEGVDAAHAPVIARLVERARRREADDLPAPLGEPESTALFTLAEAFGGTVIGFDPYTVDPAPF
ncbi:hypothetical protein SAMN02982929_05324 [Saccharopolyspora kobensis]|uniref:Uncharacterized protein n=1 Tax=Saccharopolyspora kobensis TaxID=146035 RepID=A0A1H6E1N7_9PSEU|nr:hypothetical protein [Saccharopolyspora kobensis]SEG90845.1 hypothetical protein SAMN02982929_05324 [Saccharopolyspora kobensis]SFD94200.1 hypothetical protein SAMN05216506_107300 [Saccharopolyspora kobensis]